MYRIIIYTTDNRKRRKIAEDVYNEIEMLFGFGTIHATPYRVETPFFKVDTFEFHSLRADRGHRADLLVFDEGIEIAPDDIEFGVHITHPNPRRCKMIRYQDFKKLPVSKYTGGGCYDFDLDYGASQAELLGENDPRKSR